MSFKVEPGIYWIGDPCYILNDSRYETLIEVKKEYGAYTFEESSRNGNLISIALPTDHGDGEYGIFKSLYSNKINILSDNVPLAVDSGLIAITSFDLVENVDEYDEPVGIKVEVLENISVFSNDGVLHFGTIIVDTCYQEDDPEEDEEEMWPGQWEDEAYNQ